MRRVSLSPQELSKNNVVQFLRQPRTIARILAGLFSLIIFASLVTDGYQNVTTSSQLRCVLNDNWVACSYAITAGVLAFLQSFLFLALDTNGKGNTHLELLHAPLTAPFPPHHNSPPHLFALPIILLPVFPVIWSCIWFVGFCFLANQWNRSAHHYLLGSSSASASIAFAFFSIPCWVRNSHLSFSTPVLSRRPISYKQSLDEGTVAMTTLSSVTTTSIPNSMQYHSPIEGRRASSTPTEGRRASSIPTEGRRASSTPFPQTPMENRLTFLNDN
uniref:MARVEL domain-containing protein n=1 Tax=Gopherus agassizii TaxID=38772 RepID=A0A452GIV3_9SAUR